MTNEEFITFCYQKILGRNPDEGGKTAYTHALNSNQLTREGVMIQLLTCEEYKSRATSQEYVPSGHFYSAIPSIAEREAYLSSNPSNDDELLAIKLNTDKQLDLLEKFKKYHDQCPFPDNKSKPFRYYFLNPSYSYTDALTLHSIIIEFKPKRVIEVGSGFSSCAMLDTSDFFLSGGVDFTFIEPYPELLNSLLKQSDARHTIISKPLQQVDKNIFSSLEANDILFIDSTHVSKLNSDVNKIIFEILPSLSKGVLIHFHDIFWPFEYPKEWIQEGRAWNEAYILRAFLEYNESFEILFFASYLHTYQSKWFQENMPLYLKNRGGNIWIRKVAQ